jgi:hypothetical protein
VHGEFSAGLVDLEVFVFEQFAETVVVHETLCLGSRDGLHDLFVAFDVGLVVRFRSRFVATLSQDTQCLALFIRLFASGKGLCKPAVNLDSGFLGSSNAAFTFFVKYALECSSVSVARTDRGC